MKNKQWEKTRRKWKFRSRENHLKAWNKERNKKDGKRKPKRQGKKQGKKDIHKIHERRKEIKYKAFANEENIEITN